MNRYDIRQKIEQGTAQGRSKTELFEQLRGQGLSDSKLAHDVAAEPAPALCIAHRSKVRVIVCLMLFQAVLGFLVVFGAGDSRHPFFTFGAGLVLVAINLAFAWGFYSNRIAAYNAYLVLRLLGFHNTIDELIRHPVVGGILLLYALGVFVFIGMVRSALFPDFALFGVRKIGGSYAFSS